MCRRFAQVEKLEARQLFAVTVTEGMTAAGSQLRITGTASSDRIVVLPAARGYTVTAQHGFSVTYRGKYKSLEISGGRGNDRIIVSSLVRIPVEMFGGAGRDTLAGGSGNDTIYGNNGRDLIYGEGGNDTLMSVGDGAADYLSGGAGADSFWVDSASSERVADLSKAEAERGALHRITSFLNVPEAAQPMTAQSLSTTASVNLPDPVLDDPQVSYINYSGHPLFSAAGPSENDIEQGNLGDCYLLASLGAVAETNPSIIRQTVADLGDGTYAVRFHRGSSDVYVHVDADLPSWSKNQLAYADFGADSSLWVAVVEKAYALFRSDKASYASIDTGWMTEAFDALGLQSTAYYSVSAVRSNLDDLLSGNEAVTYATADAPAGSNLLSYHAYTVDHVIRNSFGGISAVVLRNPWGSDGAGSDGADDGFVTVPMNTIAAAFSGVVAAEV